jgi:hypothetical protein
VVLVLGVGLWCASRGVQAAGRQLMAAAVSTTNGIYYGGRRLQIAAATKFIIHSRVLDLMELQSRFSLHSGCKPLCFPLAHPAPMAMAPISVQ